MCHNVLAGPGGLTHYDDACNHQLERSSQKSGGTYRTTVRYLHSTCSLTQRHLVLPV